MTKLPSQTEQDLTKNALIDNKQKSILDLSSTEMEQLALKASIEAKKRMHDKGIATIFGVDGKVFKEHPDGTITLLHG
jgi:hypothetical protein